MKGKQPLKIPDIVIILLGAGLTGFSAFAVYISPELSARVLIQGQDQSWIFPLDAEETVVVRGPLGNTVVKIHDNQTWVESSPCNNQTCVASGHIRQPGAWAACLPNNVFLMVEGNIERNDEPEKIPDSVAW
jgi:hypothetical protein